MNSVPIIIAALLIVALAYRYCSAFLAAKVLIGKEWVERILSRRHTGFNVHSQVRAKSKEEAERVGQYMIRPLLFLEHLSFLERERKVGGMLQQGRQTIFCYEGVQLC